jgi:hypothetical protein
LQSPRISLTVIPDESAPGGRDPWFGRPFDRPFDRLTVLSKVEGLTTLSRVEGGSSNLSLSQNYLPQASLADSGMDKSRLQEKANIQKS